MIQDIKNKIKFPPQKNQTFLYKEMYSHDMRSIFSKILMSAELGTEYIDNPENQAQLRELLEIIKEQVSRGNEIITNLNKLSIFNNELQNIRAIKIHDILEDVIHYIKKSNKINNISIKVESINKKISIQANELLKDIFENIIINAINYNDSKIIEIFIKISREFNKKQGNVVKIQFADNGIGIPDSQKLSIFEKDSKYKGGKGLGLGLSIVKEIIENLNGEIWVENRIKGDHSRGSNFILIFPEK